MTARADAGSSSAPDPGERTLEVRWFRPGPCPRAVRARFASLGAEREERVDHYLVPPSETMAVKMRAGAGVEVKRRDGDGEVVELAPGVVGWVESWTKWGLGPGPDRPLAETDWRPVAKSRLLVETSWAGGHLELSEVDAVPPAAPGPGWTVAAEVDRDAADAHAVLRALVGRLVAIPGLQLGAGSSCSYAGWLRGECGIVGGP